MAPLGWFSERKQERAEETYAGHLARWTEEADELRSMISVASDPHSVDDGGDVPIILKKGESALAVLQPSMLVEARRGKGHYRGGSQGFSFRVAKGVSYRVGGTRGSFQQGEEELTGIDTGTVTITSKRVVFHGDKQAREWVLSKVLGIRDAPTQPLSMISVSNRQKVSGFTYDDASAAQIRFRLALAVAMSTDTVAELRADLEEQLAEHETERPHPPPGVAAESPTSPIEGAPQRSTAPVPPSAPPPAVPAGWYADPSDPVRWRWWDGARWTENVHDA